MAPSSSADVPGVLQMRSPWSALAYSQIVILLTLSPVSCFSLIHKRSSFSTSFRISGHFILDAMKATSIHLISSSFKIVAMVEKAFPNLWSNVYDFCHFFLFLDDLHLHGDGHLLGSRLHIEANFFSGIITRKKV